MAEWRDETGERRCYTYHGAVPEPNFRGQWVEPDWPLNNGCCPADWVPIDALHAREERPSQDAPKSLPAGPQTPSGPKDGL